MAANQKENKDTNERKEWKERKKKENKDTNERREGNDKFEEMFNV